MMSVVRAGGVDTGLRALLLAIAIVPFSVLAHELAHHFSDSAFGFENPTLHYASSGFAREPEFWALVRAGDLAAAGDIAQVTHAGVSALSGLVISYLFVGLGLWGLARSGAVAFLALAMSSAARFPLVLLLYAIGRFEHTDEAHVAQALGVPEAALVGAGVIALLAATLGGAALLRRSGRRRLVLPTLVGVALGTVLWMGLLGPLVLP
jgi:hypothetical protein